MIDNETQERLNHSIELMRRTKNKLKHIKWQISVFLKIKDELEEELGREKDNFSALVEELINKEVRP